MFGCKKNIQRDFSKCFPKVSRISKFKFLSPNRCRFLCFGIFIGFDFVNGYARTAGKVKQTPPLDSEPYPIDSYSPKLPAVFVQKFIVSYMRPNLYVHHRDKTDAMLATGPQAASVFRFANPNPKACSLVTRRRDFRTG